MAAPAPVICECGHVCVPKQIVRQGAPPTPQRSVATHATQLSHRRLESCPRPRKAVAAVLPAIAAADHLVPRAASISIPLMAHRRHCASPFARLTTCTRCTPEHRLAGLRPRLLRLPMLDGLSRCPMRLKRLECQVSKSANSDTCPRLTTGRRRGGGLWLLADRRRRGDGALSWAATRQFICVNFMPNVFIWPST